MPRYDFKCPECGTTGSVTTKSYDSGAFNDMWCAVDHAKVEMKRVYSAPGVILKGSGFYRTDNPK